MTFYPRDDKGNGLKPILKDFYFMNIFLLKNSIYKYIFYSVFRGSKVKPLKRKVF